jgi:hypothetical protein
MIKPLGHSTSFRIPTKTVTHESSTVEETTPEYVPPQVTRSGRTVKPIPRLMFEPQSMETQVYATSLKRLRAMEDRKLKVKASIFEEIDNLMSPGIMESVLRKDTKQEHAKDIIRLWMFYKEKYDSNGIFLKDKCRIVTQRHFPHRTDLFSYCESH